MTKIDGNGSILDLTGLKGIKKNLESDSIVFIFEDNKALNGFREYHHKYDSLAKMHQWYSIISKGIL